MSKKCIPKELLDEAINTDREYWDLTSDPSNLDRSISLHKRIQDVTGIDWLCMQQLMSATLCSRGLKPDAANEDIYAVLRVLGWDVSE